MAPQTMKFKFVFILAAWAVLMLYALFLLNGDYNPLANYDAKSQLPWQRKGTWQLHFDNDTRELSDDELYAEMERELPNVPFAYYRRNKGLKLQLNRSCARLPSLMKLKFFNTYWQTHQNGAKTYQLYGAYLDQRPSVAEGRVVRILAMIDNVFKPNEADFCQMWIDSADAEHRVRLMPVVNYTLIWNRKWGLFKDQFYPYLLTCKVPEEWAWEIPQVVSLAARPCNHTKNSLRIVYDKPPAPPAKGSMAICVKGLDFPQQDLSAHLVEWMELMRLLGVQKIFAYNLAVHRNMTKVLDYYEREGFLQMTPITLSSGEPALGNYQHLALIKDVHNKRMNELIPYNDCFYRNMYKYEYIALLDIDEVIMPQGNFSTWQDLLAVAQRLVESNIGKCPNGYVSNCFRHAYFPVTPANHTLASDVPPYLHMLRHTWRERDIYKAGKATKCFHNTSEVLALHNHYALERLKACPSRTLDVSVGVMSHYRLKMSAQPAALVNDTTIWRYKDRLIRATEHVLQQLGFLRA